MGKASRPREISYGFSQHVPQEEYLGPSERKGKLKGKKSEKETNREGLRTLRTKLRLTEGRHMQGIDRGNCFMGV